MLYSNLIYTFWSWFNTVLRVASKLYGYKHWCCNRVGICKEDCKSMYLGVWQLYSPLTASPDFIYTRKGLKINSLLQHPFTRVPSSVYLRVSGRGIAPLISLHRFTELLVAGGQNTDARLVLRRPAIFFTRPLLFLLQRLTTAVHCAYLDPRQPSIHSSKGVLKTCWLWLCFVWKGGSWQQWRDKIASGDIHPSS